MASEVRPSTTITDASKLVPASVMVVWINPKAVKGVPLTLINLYCMRGDKEEVVTVL